METLDNNEIYKSLIKEAECALKSKRKNLVYQAYGAARMARMCGAISKDAFLMLNRKLVRDGINNPKAGLE